LVVNLLPSLELFNTEDFMFYLWNGLPCCIFEN
jgi:hypothetical protein